VIEARRSQPGEPGLGELRTIEREERRCDGMESEGVTFLHHDAGKLAPDFDDEGFGHGLDHGLNLLLEN
jgi:hypothetical protein